MASSAWLTICEPETTTAISGADYCSGTPGPAASPIDDYYEYVEHLLTLGDEDALDESQTLGRLLLLGLVSGVEAYLRSVLTGLLQQCPVARKTAADQQISFGAIDYYGVEEIEWGLFDVASLAGASEITAKTRKLLGLDIDQGSSLKAALGEFDKVCHLRHAAVHHRGALGRGNAVALGLAEADGRQALEVRMPSLHAAGLACHSAVRAYNRFVYRRTVERWIAQGRFTGQWSEDRDMFKPLFELFHSERDAVGPRHAYQAYRSLPLG